MTIQVNTERRLNEFHQLLASVSAIRQLITSREELLRLMAAVIATQLMATVTPFNVTAVVARYEDRFHGAIRIVRQPMSGPSGQASK